MLSFNDGAASAMNVVTGCKFSCLTFVLLFHLICVTLTDAIN